MTTFSERVVSSSFRLEVQTVQRLAPIIDSPRSLTVFLLVKHGEWRQLIDLSIDPSAYEDPRDFARDYLITEILRKSPNLPLGIDRRGRALDAFIDAELSCWFSNHRFNDDPHPSWVRRFVKVVAEILGPCSEEALTDVMSACRFGPGASTGVRGVGSVASDKYDKPLHMTASLIPFTRTILGERWWEHQSQPKIVVAGNKFTTVPKSAKTDRGICVEPTLNMYVQLGLGTYIRSRLKRSGLNLGDQTLNQDLAASAYDRGLATIDLAQASDSVSWGLIFHFFPERWQELIFLLRSEYTTLPDGEVMELGKLSSMGNGFTFELESLIFYSVVKSVVPRDELPDCGVYGDDIIVPKAYATEVIEALNFLGFRVNSAKSFLAGNFFESCGADFFKGTNVRPFYLKGSEGNIPYSLQIANALRRWTHRYGGEEFCDATFRPVWSWLVRLTPPSWRHRVPPEFGDCGITSSSKESVHLPRPKGQHEGKLVRYTVLSLRSLTLGSLGVLLSALARDRDGSSKRPWYEKPGPKLDPPRAPFTFGRQARRGLFGRTITRSAIYPRWPSGWDWA